MEKQNVQAIRLSIADPTPLGLFGLAMVTLVASSQKLGITDGHIPYLTLGYLPWRNRAADRVHTRFKAS